MKSPFAKPINASLSPNTDTDDVLRAWMVMAKPWTWKTGETRQIVADWFSERYGVSRVEFFDSGRSALYELLGAFGIGDGDEVITQAFTCVAVPNSVSWTGATPVYADIDETYNIDPASIVKRITPKTKAIIVQHTLGIPAAMKHITSVAKKHDLVVLEDCAHAIGAYADGKPVGTWGDAAFFSFGRDKVVSSVFGGAGFVHDRHSRVQEAFMNRATGAPMPSYGWIAQQLFHPILFSVALPLYSTGLGKALIEVSKRLRLISIPVQKEECRGQKPMVISSGYPNALAQLLQRQLEKLERDNLQRREVAHLYRKALTDSGYTLPPDTEGSVYLRFPVQIDAPGDVYRRAKKEGIILGTWYSNIIDPKAVSHTTVGYRKGMCPHAERAAKRILNLPTRIRISDATRVISAIT